MSDDLGEPVTTLARRVLAPNPGPMTLEGTNSYLLRASGSEDLVVVDPGPADPDHLARLAAAGRVVLVLVTHHHADHVEGVAELRRMTGAPARGLDPGCSAGAPPLEDGETIELAGVRIEVLATPGHTADSACFRLADDGPHGSVLTGDTILGRGTTVIASPDGELGAYLDSLERLAAIGPATVLPAHGPVLPDLARVADDYLRHRRSRLEQVREALAVVGEDAGAAVVARIVYPDLADELRPAAEASVRAQLAWLRRG